MRRFVGEHDEDVRRLHGEGLSHATIGAKIGLSKSQVSRVVLRLHLPARPSPMNPKREEPPKLTGTSTLPPLASLKD